MLRNRVLRTFLFSLPILILSCGEDEEALMIADLQTDLSTASTIIDSLNLQIDDVNYLLDDARARVDSLDRVDDKLLKTIKALNKNVTKFRKLYTQQQQKSRQLAVEIDRLKVEKQADRQVIASLRGEADSLNSQLLEAHTSIRRQSDHIRQMEMDLAQTQDDLETLRRAQFEVRVLVASEDFLTENGFMKTSRPFGRGFRKSYALIRKLNPADSMVRKVPIGEELTLEGKLVTAVDHYGSLKKGDDYSENKEGELRTMTFTNEMLGGTDVLAVVKD